MELCWQIPVSFGQPLTTFSSLIFGVTLLFNFNYDCVEFLNNMIALLFNFFFTIAMCFTNDFI